MSNFETYGDASRYVEENGFKMFGNPTNVFDLADAIKRLKEYSCCVWVDPKKNCSDIKRLLNESEGS